jgi:ABC-type nitrate/sulfonate/bicarbonate transport system permease component
MDPPVKRNGIIFVVAVVALLEALCDARIIPLALFPPPHATLLALRDGIGDGSLLGPFGLTIGHILIAWISACVLGIAVGSLVGTSPAAASYVMPTLEFMRPLPAAALVPAALLIVGRTDGMIVGVAVFGAIWPILLASVHGFGSVDPRLLDACRSMRLSRSKIAITVLLPSALPEIFAGARVGLALTIILCVVGEILASFGGLGASINAAAHSYHTADLYAGVILISMLGVVATLALESVERYVLRWRNVGSALAP